MHDFKSDLRFKDLKPFEKKLWLSSPTMHGEELEYIKEAYHTNWMSTIGENINVLEKQLAAYVGVHHAVALSCGTAALHLAVKLAAERLYGMPRAGVGALHGRKVFCSDMTFDATVNPIAYEGGEAVFIDTEYDTWNMCPEALREAFKIYPEVKLVVLAHLYGTPGKMNEIQKICKEHGALIVEDAAESLGATYQGVQTGCFGDYAIVSFNGNKIITGSSGGAFLTDNEADADKVRKWSTQSREAAAWYQHEELGYNYRMSNVIAGVVRGQMGHLDEHIEQKQKIYQRYKEGLKDLPVKMNPWDEANSKPNFWLSCLLIDKEAMCETVRSENECFYLHQPGKSCPDEILEALKYFNAEARPLWKPMHMQPIYRNHPFITAMGNGRGKTNAYISNPIANKQCLDVGVDIFSRGLCLPSDNKMTSEQQDMVIDIIHRCFK